MTHLITKPVIKEVYFEIEEHKFLSIRQVSTAYFPLKINIDNHITCYPYHQIFAVCCLYIQYLKLSLSTFERSSICTYQIHARHLQLLTLQQVHVFYQWNWDATIFNEDEALTHLHSCFNFWPQEKKWWYREVCFIWFKLIFINSSC